MKKQGLFRLIRTSTLVLAAVAAMCLMTRSADAQGCGYGGWYGGYGNFHGVNRLNVNIGRGYGGVHFGTHTNFYQPYRYHYRRPATWHNTSHFDYHPGRFVPHGNHLDYIPGHYHWHRSGHWHRW